MTTLRDVVDLVGGLSSTVLIAGGVLLFLGLVVVAVLAHRARSAGVVTAATTVAILIGLGTTVEGAVKLAQGSLDARGIWVVIPATLFESVAVAIGSRAVAYAKEHGHPGRYGAWLWRIGLIAGFVVSLGGTSFAERAFRFVAPLVGVLLLHLRVTPDTGQRTGTVAWRWTPRRIGIRLGMIEPGERDVETVHREHRIAALTVTAHKAHHGGFLPHQWYTARLRRLALVADDAMVAEARIRVLRVHQIETLTAPPADDHPTEQVTPGGEQVGEQITPMPAYPAGDPDAPGARVPVDALVTPESEQIISADDQPPDSGRYEQVDGSKPRVRGSAELIARKHAEHPTATHQQLAELTGFSVATVRRNRPRVEQPVRVNGVRVPAVSGPEVTG